MIFPLPAVVALMKLPNLALIVRFHVTLDHIKFGIRNIHRIESPANGNIMTRLEVLISIIVGNPPPHHSTVTASKPRWQLKLERSTGCR